MINKTYSLILSSNSVVCLSGPLFDMLQFANISPALGDPAVDAVSYMQRNLSEME